MAKGVLLDFGLVTAYGSARAGGYTKTEKEFFEELAAVGEIWGYRDQIQAAMEQAISAAEAASSAAEAAEEAVALEIDDTLTQEGKAAESKKVGDEIEELRSQIATMSLQIADIIRSLGQTAITGSAIVGTATVG